MDTSQPTQQQQSTKKIVIKRLLFYDYSIVSRNMEFILFLLVLVLIYVYNGQAYEYKVREITKRLSAMKDIEYEYRYYHSLWTLKTKESELEKIVKDRGLTIAKKPAFLITDK